MSIFRAYIKPFDDTGTLTDFIEVTDDVVFQGFGSLKRNLDNDRYQVGLFKYDKISFKLRNEHGLYSDIGAPKTIFKSRRGGSEFKITWEIQDFKSQCGIAVAGACKISPEVDVFTGILNDQSAILDIDDQVITFHSLGKESIFSEVETPYSSLSNGDLYSAAILTVLNQSEITKYLTVDVANISVGLDQAIDDISKLENTTVKESLDKLLFQSNTVLYIENGVVYTSNRDGGASSIKTFYGQASNNGIEDIINITSVATGINSMFNYWTWAETNLVSIDVTSVSENGIRKQEIGFEEITNTAKRQAVIDNHRVDFGSKKEEFEVTVPVTYENLGIKILDQIRVDYPAVYREADLGTGIPLYGVAKYGAAVYPAGEFSITISDLVPYKVAGIIIDTKNQNLKFKLKEM